MEIARKDEEIQRLQIQPKDCLERFRQLVGFPRDVFSKAQIFDKYLKNKGKPTVPKIIKILVEFQRKMDAILAEMRKLLGAPKPEQAKVAEDPNPIGTSKKLQMELEVTREVPQESREGGNC